MLNYRVFIVVFLLTLASVAAYGQSTSDILNRAFDSATNSLRVVLS